MAGPDDEREIEPGDDEFVVLPDRTSDEFDIGWGEWRGRDDDDRLTADRPPHWG